MEITPNKEELIDLANYKMPFGKYKDQYLVNLPLAYYVWFKKKGFPIGKLGKYMQMMMEIKSNGLEPIILQIQRDFPKE